MMRLDIEPVFGINGSDLKIYRKLLVLLLGHVAIYCPIFLILSFHSRCCTVCNYQGSIIPKFATSIKYQQTGSTLCFNHALCPQKGRQEKWRYLGIQISNSPHCIASWNWWRMCQSWDGVSGSHYKLGSCSIAQSFSKQDKSCSKSSILVSPSFQNWLSPLPPTCRHHHRKGF